MKKKIIVFCSIVASSMFVNYCFGQTINIVEDTISNDQYATIEPIPYGFDTATRLYCHGQNEYYHAKHYEVAYELRTSNNKIVYTGVVCIDGVNYTNLDANDDKQYYRAVINAKNLTSQ